MKGADVELHLYFPPSLLLNIHEPQFFSNFRMLVTFQEYGRTGNE